MFNFRCVLWRSPSNLYVYMGIIYIIYLRPVQGAVLSLVVVLNDIFSNPVCKLKILMLLSEQPDKE